MKRVLLSQAWEGRGLVAAEVHGPARDHCSEVREAYKGRVSIEFLTGAASLRVSPTVAEARELAAALLAAAGAVEAAP